MDITVRTVSKFLHKQRLNILDIGCGNGHDLEELAKHHPGNFFYGFDKHFNGTKEIEINKSRVILKHGEAVSGWPKEFRDIHFDIIYSSALLHLIPKREWNKLFSNIKHHLVHGGRCILIDTMTKGREVYYTREELERVVSKYFHITSVEEWVQHDILLEPHNYKMILMVCKRRFL